MNVELNTLEVLLTSGHGDSESAPEPIAIIGMGCRFPGGVTDPESYWKLLHDGVDAITDIPADRWDARVFYDPEPGKAGKTNARWGGFLAGIDQFDSHFFGISPREAARMDPQQRLLMEVAWEALEDAGLALEGIAESKTSVYVGISSYDYMNLQAAGDRNKIDVYTNTGGALSIAANRISYSFNFKGPSMAVDTACSSALVGVHLACQSMWYEGCTMALAGAASTCCSPRTATSALADCRCCRRTAVARLSTPAPTASSAVKGRAWWSSSPCRAPWPTTIAFTLSFAPPA